MSILDRFSIEKWRIACPVITGFFQSSFNTIYVQLVPYIKEQLVTCYGLATLLNLSNFIGWVEYYCLYGSVPLFSNDKTRHFCFTINIISLHNLCYTFHWSRKPSRSKQQYLQHNVSLMLWNQGRSRVLVILT